MARKTPIPPPAPDLAYIAEPLRHLAVPIDTLAHDPANARTHGEQNLAAICASLRRFGQRLPLVVQRDGMIVRAGNGRLDAARSLGWTHMASLIVDEADADATAFALADNRTAELAEWDDARLAELLKGLPTDVRCDVGFTEKDMNALLASLAGPVVEDEPPAPLPEPVSKRGDLWVMGGHRLLCGDSTDGGDVAMVMNGERATICFTSPPYGQQRDYTEASAEHTNDWDTLMRGVFGALPMADDGQVLVNLGMIHRDGEWIPYWDAWIAWMREQKWRRFGWYVWDQGSGLPGDWNGRFAPSHEFVFHFNKVSVKPNKIVECDPENVEIGKRATSRRNAGGKVTSMRASDGEVKEVSSTIRNPFKIPDSVVRISRCATIDMARENHPATFPIQFPKFVLEAWQGLVYEPFSGSGTTIIAAEQLGRRCYAIEIEPRYVDVAVRRWQKLTGKHATHADTGKTWAETAAEHGVAVPGPTPASA